MVWKKKKTEARMLGSSYLKSRGEIKSLFVETAPRSLSPSTLTHIIFAFDTFRGSLECQDVLNMFTGVSDLQTLKLF